MSAALHAQGGQLSAGVAEAAGLAEATAPAAASAPCWMMRATTVVDGVHAALVLLLLIACGRGALRIQPRTRRRGGAPGVGGMP